MIVSSSSRSSQDSGCCDHNLTSVGHYHCRLTGPTCGAWYKWTEYTEIISSWQTGTGSQVDTTCEQVRMGFPTDWLTLHVWWWCAGNNRWNLRSLKRQFYFLQSWQFWPCISWSAQCVTCPVEVTIRLLGIAHFFPKVSSIGLGDMFLPCI